MQRYIYIPYVYCVFMQLTRTGPLTTRDLDIFFDIDLDILSVAILSFNNRVLASGII